MSEAAEVPDVEMGELGPSENDCSVDLDELAVDGIFESDPAPPDAETDAVLEEREAISRVNVILQWYAAELRQTPISRIDQLTDELDRRIRELEAEIGTEVIPAGYVAESALLDTLLQVGAVTNKKLPSRHRLKVPYAMDLAVNLVQNWFPKTWGESVLHLVNLDTYLEHKKQLVDYTVLPPAVSDELYSKARDRLASVEQMLTNTPEGDLSEEDYQDYAAEQNHLVHLLLGHHPPFNSETHARWRTFDVAHLFMPLADTYVLTPEQTKYALVYAEALLKNPEPGRSPTNWVPASKAEQFLQTGHLPAPWKAHPSFFEALQIYESGTLPEAAPPS